MHCKVLFVSFARNLLLSSSRLGNQFVKHQGKLCHFYKTRSVRCLSTIPLMATTMKVILSKPTFNSSTGLIKLLIEGTLLARVGRSSQQTKLSSGFDKRSDIKPIKTKTFRAPRVWGQGYSLQGSPRLVSLLSKSMDVSRREKDSLQSAESDNVLLWRKRVLVQEDLP